MTPREKKLLSILGTALLVILSFIAYSHFYLPEREKAERQRRSAEKKLMDAQQVLSLRDELEPEIKWLKRSGTAPVSPQDAQSKLQTLLRKQANSRNLDIRDSRIIPFQTGHYFDRVGVLFKVTGSERDVFSWLASIHLPNQRQVVTKMEIEPQNNDLTRVEVEVEVEKWIISPDET